MRNQLSAAITHFGEASPEHLADAVASLHVDDILEGIESTEASIGALLLDLGTVRFDSLMQLGSAADVGRSVLMSALEGANNDKAVLARGYAELLHEYYQEQAQALTAKLEEPLHDAARHLQAAMEAVRRFDEAQDELLQSTEQGSAFQQGAIGAATDYKDETL